MLVLKEDGTMEHGVYEGDEKLRGLVCPESRMLEPVALAPNIHMWGDEEAKCRRNHRVNLYASLLYRAIYGGDYMAGTVAILESTPGGETRELSPETEKAIARILFRFHRMYKAGLLGPRFVASGPRIEIREMTEAEFAAMFGGRSA